jgi:hypothetical protein
LQLRLFLPALIAGAAMAAVPAQLSIVKATVHQIEDEPATTDVSYVPGETIYFSCFVEGYRTTPPPSTKVNLSYTVDAFDSHNTRITETITGKIESELSPQDKQWKPKLQHAIAVPPLADPGTYKVVAQVKDELAGTTASKEVAFQVRGHEVPSSDSLVVRNFHFYRDEEARDVLITPAYRPGDTVWARFDITGYKFAEGNRMDVSYDVAVLSPSGKQIFKQENAAIEQSASFYPKRYLPGSLSLSLQPNTTPGNYTIAIVVRDAIGKQTSEVKEPFSIQ